MIRKKLEFTIFQLESKCGSTGDGNQMIWDGQLGPSVAKCEAINPLLQLPKNCNYYMY